jgi:ectoine hydroxylase-related dioxygenase (phytanoyl-CoA dioxygenase family)
MSLLTANERGLLDDEGWLHLVGVIDGVTVERMRAAWERCAKVAQPRGNNAGPPRLRAQPELAICATEPRVLAAVGHLLAGDVVLATLEGRDPPVGRGQQGLHVDWVEPVAPGTHLVVNAFWILDDMDEGNGGTRIVPGTHRSGMVPRGELAQPQGRHMGERVLTARAGDVVIVSSHVWHSGTVNRSGRRRRVINAHFATAAVAARMAATAVDRDPGYEG